MFLQILPPETSVVSSETTFDSQLLFVILGMAVGAFIIIKVAKFLSKIKISKRAKNPSYTS